MAEEIKDAISGNVAKVDHEGKLHTYSLTESGDKHINKDHGKSWSLFFAITPNRIADGISSFSFQDYPVRNERYYLICLWES